MEFKGANNSSQSQPSSHVNHPQPPAPRGGEGNSFKMVTRDEGNKKVVWIGVLIAALLVLGGGGWWLWNKVASPDGVKSGQYQAVFLTNGQVYFCHLSTPTGQYLGCDDIYYLQVQSSVQPDNNKSSDQNPQVSLAKLGNELHGPEDHMAINRDQVLFWENLKDSGKVVQAIKQNQKQ
jgi:hypothetical protein